MQRSIEVSPERLPRWLRNFTAAHGDMSPMTKPERVTLVAPDDGTRVDIDVPFPPLAVDHALPYGGLIEHAQRERRIGVLLVRRGGYAVGVFEGQRLVASKVGSRRVQGRTAAGGWSQQRFARRRENQAKELYGAAADVAARVLPEAGRIEGLVVGGDKPGVESVLADKRLTELRELIVGGHLAVPDPKLEVLKAAAEKFRAVTLHITDG